MKKILKVTCKNYVLTCHMSDGAIYEYDMSFVKHEPDEMLRPLKDEGFLAQVFLEFGSLAWPNGYDIHANTVAREGRLVKQVA